MKRIVAAASTVALGVVLSAMPAFATVSKSGQTSCGSNRSVAWSVNSKGDAYIYRWSIGTPYDQRHTGASFVRWYSVSSLRSTGWVISATDYYDSTTYGYCANTGAKKI